MLDNCNKTAQDLSLQLNQLKSHCMVIDKAAVMDIGHIKFGGQDIQWCQSVKYLGVYLMAGIRNYVLIYLQSKEFFTVRVIPFLARDVIYTSRAYATMSVSVCLSVSPSVCEGSALWSRCMPGRGKGSSRAMLATARPSCLTW